MDYKYGTAPAAQFQENECDLINQIWKILPYKENDYEDIDTYITSLLLRIAGLNELLGNPPELITLMSLLETVRTESTHKLYRKAIFDCCNIIERLKERQGDLDV